MQCALLSIDWPSIGSLFAGLGSLLAGGATIALAIYASRGLHAWKEQQLGTKKLDLAQEILAEVYTTEEVLKFVVNPFVSATELGRVERLDGETDADYELRRTFDAIIVRYEDHAEQFSKLRALLFRARAVLGEEAYEAVKELLLIRNSIQSAAHQAYLHSREVARMERQTVVGIPVDGQQYQKAFDQMRNAQDSFWGLRGKNTIVIEIEQRTARCTRELEKIRDSILS